jgi:predicted nucleic acid-binding protein
MRSVDNREVELIVPTVVLAEALHVSERRNPGVTFEELLGYITTMTNAVIVNLDMAVLRLARELPSDLELHDRLIAATARLYGAQLVTRDRQFRGVIETVW